MIIIIIKTHNQHIHSKAFSQALPEQLVSDPTLPQEPLHAWSFLLTVRPQLSLRSRDAAAW